MTRKTKSQSVLAFCLIGFFMSGSLQRKPLGVYTFQVSDNSSVDPSPPMGSPADPAPVPTYQDVAPILTSKCQSCHSNAADNGLGGISVDNEDEVLEHAPLVLRALETGWMPFEEPDWHTSDDGIKLINWLKSKIPPEPTPEPTPEPYY